MEPPPPTLPARHTWLAPAVVWGAWALMLLAALLLVGVQGRNTPISDEWAFIPFLTGDEEVTAGWLWSQHSDHRIPLLRLVFLATGALFQGDLRAGMFLNALALGALACGMIRVAAGLRGRTAFADAFFPLVFLHWGVVSTFCLGSADFAYLLPTLLASSLLLLIVRVGGRLTFVSGVLAGVCVVLLPLSSAAGSAYVVPLGLWLAWWGLSRGRRGALLVGPFALLGLALVPISFLGNETPWWRTPRSDGWDVAPILKTAGQVLSLGFGEGVEPFWPYVAAGIVLLFTASAGLAARPLRGGGLPERTRALGLLFFLTAGTCLALGIGWGRTDAALGIASYGIFIVPLLCAAYFIWELYGPPSVRPWVQLALLLFTGVMIWPNTKKGLTAAANLVSDKDAPLQSLYEGVPVSRYIKRHLTTILGSGYPGQVVSNDYLEECLRALKREGFGHYGNLAEEPPSRRVSLPLTAAAVEGGTWRGGTFTGKKKGASVTFALEKPTYVYGLRIYYSHVNEKGGPAFLRMVWKRNEQDEFEEVSKDNSEERLVEERLLQTGANHSVTIWTLDTMSGLHLYPDAESPLYTFRISKIVLLVPVETQ